MLDEGQITSEEGFLACERQQLLAEQGGPLDLERLGQSFAFADAIFALLDRAGWSIHVRAPFGGQIDDEGTRGVLVIAAHRFADIPPLELCGRTRADCAVPLMVEADKYMRAIAAARARGEGS